MSKKFLTALVLSIFLFTGVAGMAEAAQQQKGKVTVSQGRTAKKHVRHHRKKKVRRHAKKKAHQSKRGSDAASGKH